MTKITALIVAAGRGSRLGGTLPKQYLSLQGKAILAHTLEAFSALTEIGEIRVVIDPSLAQEYLACATGISKLGPWIPGGARRQDSVRLGLEALVGDRPDLVLIHDAARPFVTPALIRNVIAALEECEGALPSLPVFDSVKRGAAGRVLRHVDRQGLFRAQTPQGFRFDKILAAHRHAAGGVEMTDDAAVAEAFGLSVALVAGSERNFKITTSDDWERATAMTGREYRSGNGYDVHRLVEGDHLWLCGVRLPHDRTLEGHSDADVALHALTDALLGAIGAGDIGLHFPPSDVRWKGAPSWRFLAHAAALIGERGGAIVHVDVTLICERPKIGPHRAAMKHRLAEILGLAEDRISVKATTTERLGFTGREEGIAAQATATVALPLHG
ncbi:MAG TPA: bifunctional 2-C-methyl-D-erythritol 4-phosphate cytidylyltransferase/2-C-methyl-D-erythritol 2,4-cyclodiphosphate synthase [Dongiaceae bacterium]|nr:bifunctional 2-C-methyl-D-erythritol 4-phosphate cytidylyltransferase/2-C-methyl-D-erythritol 2,4-cyclodiphosphate synthase [Dongiaceae bacterium]